mgnify:CR=1 FL=1
MSIWLLQVVNPEHRDWGASTHKGDVVVRAPSEATARKEASFEFGIASEVRLGESVKFSPWEQAEIVSCEPLEGTNYEPDGEPEVLSTKHN